MQDPSSLVEKARRGDRDAFAALYDRYARAVFLDLVGRLGSREDAQDVLQTTFQSAWKGLGTLRKPSRFVPWVFRIARNGATDVLRQRLRHPTEPLAHDVFAPAGAVFGGESETLQRLVHELKPESRALLMLRAVQEWPADAIAQAWGQSAATIRRRYAKTLEHLRANLALEEKHA